MADCSKTGLLIQIGTHFGIRATPKRTGTRIERSPRTQVTELPTAPHYRFFSKRWRKMAHANLSQWNTLAPQVFRPATRLGCLLPRLSASASRRHAFPAAQRSLWRLLLSLRRIQNPWPLRENVRVQEIRIPLVGHQLRQAPHEHATPRFPRRPPLPASRPH